LTELDLQNAGFWDELCGSALARQLGITDASADSLRRFDEAYFGFYPYLLRHLQPIAARRGRWRSASATGRSPSSWRAPGSITTAWTSPRVRSRWCAAA
jgi:hypothetical protein